VSATERPYAGIVSRTVALAIDAGMLTIGFAVASGVLGLILSLFTAVEVSSPGAVLGGLCADERRAQLGARPARQSRGLASPPETASTASWIVRWTCTRGACAPARRRTSRT
jgi:hypothetical protein